MNTSRFDLRFGKAMPNPEWIEFAARLGGAVLVGAILGVNRDLHRKPAGLRWSAWEAPLLS